MWFRRDLRLSDNPALLAAGSEGDVVPLFVVDPAVWGPAGGVRRAYLVRSLRALDDSIGGGLVVRFGHPARAVAEIADEVGADTVHITADFGPYGSSRDADVGKALATAGRQLRPTGSPYAVAPGTLRTGNGEPFRVYSAFQRRWLEHGWAAPAEAADEVAWRDSRSDEWPSAGTDVDLPAAGEEAATRAWASFRDERLGGYDEGRDVPGGEGSSRMSTYLRWGEIHPRTLLADLAPKRSKGAAVYRGELAWREFYADVLWHRPESARADLRADLAEMAYDAPRAAFDAWRDGRTGSPIVGAGMRQLRATGHMHNRVRMVCASFLVKDLHVWWGHGARHFMEWLADGDLASNQQNWQWVAGSGTDAAPYFRVFNPTLQGSKFDPDGSYVRRWVRGLAEVAAEHIHEPGAVDGYPTPLVDHAEERREALARYDEVKRSAPS